MVRDTVAPSVFANKEYGVLMQSEAIEIEMDILSRESDDIPKTRQCLRCKVSFWSDGFGQRICNRCKGSSAWRVAMPEGIRQGRLSSGGRTS